MRLGVLPFSVGSRFADLERSWLTAEEAGFDALWTVDHLTPSVELTPAWEASSLLVAMAARTRTISIGVLVFDVLLRHPFIMAGAVAVAQALSGGRVQVGFGIGDKFSKVDHKALGVPFPSFAERAHYLEACCTSLPRLWRGDTISDPELGLNDAALGPVEVLPPPLIVGGGSRTLMELAVRYAQGWNLFTQDPEVFSARVAVLTQIEAAMERPKPLARSVYLFLEHAGRDPRGLVEAFEAVGADELMFVLRRPSADSIRTLARQVR